MKIKVFYFNNRLIVTEAYGKTEKALRKLTDNKREKNIFLRNFTLQDPVHLIVGHIAVKGQFHAHLLLCGLGIPLPLGDHVHVLLFWLPGGWLGRHPLHWLQNSHLLVSKSLVSRVVITGNFSRQGIFANLL